MKNHHRREKRKYRPTKPIASSASEPRDKQRKALKHIFADVIVGLLLTGILLIGKRTVEQTQTCQFIEESFYDLLQLRLSSKLDPETLKVIVVDITGMKMDRHPRERNYDFTDREELLNLIREIAEQQPRAIGVDIDFTPYANQREQDRAFLDFCLSLRKPLPSSHMAPVPVYVGLHEAVALGPDLCLGEPRFRDLPAFMGFPKVKENEGRKRITDWVEIPYQDAANELTTWYCPSLATAVTQMHVAPPSPLIAWAIERTSLVNGRGYKSKEYLIDYSPLEALERNTISLQNLDSSLRENAFYDKYVLIGRGKLSQDTGDKYPIPGRRSYSHAGVYVHACAAYTLLRGALFEPSGKGRLLLDLVLSTLVILAVALVRYHYRYRAESVAHDRVLAFFTFMAICFTISLGFYLVHVTRLVWDDFVVVGLVLLSHRSIEERTERITQWVVRCFRAAWLSLVIRKPTASVEEKEREI